MNGAQAMVKCLENEGVEMVFGYPGVAICPFYDSLLDTDIKSVLIRTEQNAAHAASGLARVTGKVGVCAVTSGPGATNLITGIATAFADSIPLVCITGQVNSERTDRQRRVPGGGYHWSGGIVCQIQLSGQKCRGHSANF